jgi:TRAP transporter TAXI family solute receptor
MRTVLALVFAITCAGPAAAIDNLRLFTLGSAGEGGGYAVAARALCDVFNRAERARFRCSPEVTSGSLYNLAALREGQLDLAMTQSDWQEHAVNGTSVFAAAGPDVRLRSVMALYPEPFTVIARRDAGIASATDLVGKRVDIGHPSSGRYATMRLVMALLDLDESSFGDVRELHSGAAIDALCQNRIDATVLIVGHPNAAVARALRECDAVLVPLTGPAIDRLVAENDDYGRYYIPIQAYPEMTGDVPTFAVIATLVVREGVADEMIEPLVRHTLDNLERLRARDPLLAFLEPGFMRSAGLTAPLHPGAAAAFDAYEAAE